MDCLADYADQIGSGITNFLFLDAGKPRDLVRSGAKLARDLYDLARELARPRATSRDLARDSYKNPKADQ